MIVLIGHGYIGSAIAAELTARGLSFRWPHHGQIRPFGARAQVIVNAAGYTGTPNVDACERNKGECIAGNITWPMSLQDYAGALPVIHVTSGCVYTGLERPFTEEDAPNFSGSFYSACKALTERYLRTCSNAYILRVRLPFGPAPHRKNLLIKLECYARLIDQTQSVSYVPDVARVVAQFCEKLPTPGVYNVVNPGPVRISDIALIMGWKKQFMTPAEFAAIVAAPRSECELSTEKLSKVVQLPSALDRLKECAQNFR